MQDTLAAGGVQAGSGENHVALFANPFHGGKEEALVIRASGELDYLQRDPASETGWSQAIACADYPQDVPADEVVVVVHPVDLSVWALVVGPFVVQEDIRVRPMRLTAKTVNGVTTCSWEWLPLAIPFRSPTNQPLDHVSRLRVVYDGTVPHVIGIDATGKGVIDIRPNFTVAPSGEYFAWTNVPYPMTLDKPDTYQYTAAVKPDGTPALFVLQDGIPKMIQPSSGTMLGFAGADLVGAFQPPRGAGWTMPGSVWLDTSGDLVSVGYLTTGPVVAKTPGLGLVTATLWADANGMLHVYGQDKDKTLQVLHQSSWSGVTPVWSRAVAPTTVTPALVGVHPKVAAFTVDPYPDLLPSELMLLEGAQADEAWCIGTQDVASTRWLVEAVKLPPGAAADPDIVTHYVCDITLTDADNGPILSHPVSLSADSRTEIICDGAAYLVGPGYSAALTTNALGKVRVALPAGSLTPPQLRVEAVGVEKGAQIQPAAGIHDYLSGNGTLASQKDPFNGTTLMAASADGKPVVNSGTTQASADAVAAGVANAFDAVPGKQLTSKLFRGAGPAPRIHGFAVGTGHDGTVGYLEFDSPEELNREIEAIRALPEYGGIWDDFLDFASDVWEGIKNGAVEIYKAFASTGIGKVFVWICGKIVELAEFVIDTVEAAVHVVEAVFRTIVEAVKKVIEWLKALFSFQDIWDTKTALQGVTTQILKAGKDVVTKCQGGAHDWFQSRKKDVENYFADARAQFGTTSAGDFQNVTPPPATSTGSVPTTQELQHNPQATWMLDRLSSGSGVKALNAAPLTLSGDIPLAGVLDELLAVIDGSTLIGDVASAVAGVTEALLGLVNPADPRAASTLGMLSLLDSVENLALAALKGLDEVTAGILAIVARDLLAVDDLLKYPLDLGFINSLYTWLQGQLDNPGVIEPLTIGGLVFLVIAFFVTTIYKLFFGVDNPPFPGGSFPAFPGSQGGAHGRLADAPSVHFWQGMGGIVGFLGALVNVIGDLLGAFEVVGPLVSRVFAGFSIVLLGLSSVALTILNWTQKPNNGAAAVVALSQVLLFFFKTGFFAKSFAKGTEPWIQNSFDQNKGPILVGITGLVRFAGTIAMDVESNALPYFWITHLALCVSTMDSFARWKFPTPPGTIDPAFRQRLAIVAGVNALTSAAGFIMTSVAGFSGGPGIDIPDNKISGKTGQRLDVDIKSMCYGGDLLFNSPLHNFRITGDTAGLTIDAKTGRLTGTLPATAGDHQATIQVSDSNSPPLVANVKVTISVS